MEEPLSSLDQERKGEVLAFVAQLFDDFAIPTLNASLTLQPVLIIEEFFTGLYGGGIR